ncbi:MAG TPA: alkaline phosphatase family protein [Thermoleophilaceae bacterium]|nr:alkaline phosphatase family protein [Thermoleophilaceae bacterium]
MTKRMLTAIAGVLAVAASGAPAQAQDHAPKTPIGHIVTLMQENHSFDNYFGTYPGADGIPKGTCMPVDPTKGDKPCVKPFWIGGRAVQDLGHTSSVFGYQYNHGKMNGFLRSGSIEGIGVQPNVMGHYDGRDLPYYWNIAKRYVLFDRFFTSAAAGSVQNHMFWVSGQAGSPVDVIPPNGFGNIPTIFDRLEKAGVSWKFYVQNYRPHITYRSRGNGDAGAQPVWVPLLAYNRYLDNPKLLSHIVDMSEYYKDLQNGTLPAVSYLVPAGSSEHPPGNIKAGERFIRTLISQLMRSSSWKSSAFTWTYDDWGGWYDHVKPPQMDRYGYGFRAPALLVSPWAKRGFIDHTTLDFTSILKFIENNWSLKPLAQRDARANSLANAFDFKQAPRRPAFIPATLHPPSTATHPHRYIYIVYGLPLLLMALTMAYALGIKPKLRRKVGTR